jgi:hypothetical protein
LSAAFVPAHNLTSALPIQLAAHNLTSALPIQLAAHNLTSALPIQLAAHNLTSVLPAQLAAVLQALLPHTHMLTHAQTLLDRLGYPYYDAVLCPDPTAALPLSARPALASFTTTTTAGGAAPAAATTTSSTASRHPSSGSSECTYATLGGTALPYLEGPYAPFGGTGASPSPHDRVSDNSLTDAARDAVEEAPLSKYDNYGGSAMRAAAAARNEAVATALLALALLAAAV